VECNFRVFQGIFPGAKNTQGFQGLPWFPGVVSHPVDTLESRINVFPVS